MPETRKWPRFLPRAGANIKITIGQPMTPMLRPLIDEWRDISSASAGELGVGGEWAASDKSASEEEQRSLRSEGRLADGRERDIRIKLTAIMQEEVRKMGEKIEEEEGKFARGEWTQSRVFDPSLPPKPPR